MPHSHKREHDPDIIHGRPRSAQRHVHIAHNPHVVALMPRAPEPERRVVIRHTPDHVLRGLDPVGHGPQAEEPPDDHELEPDQHQVEEADHADLQDWVVVPSFSLADRHHVHVVARELHGEERKAQAGCPHQQRLDGDGFGVPELWRKSRK